MGPPNAVFRLSLIARDTIRELFLVISLRIPLCLLVTLTCFAQGCSTDRVHNSSFPLTIDEATQAWQQMKDAPKRLERPLVVLGGWLDPFIVAPSLVKRFKSVTEDDRIVGVSFGFFGTFESCREHLIDRVVEAFGEEVGQETVKVDVVAFSMGGLVARDAAAPRDDAMGSSRRLRIVRLFTISTPHRGARLAGMPTFNRLQVEMRSGSKFLNGLDKALNEADYDLLPYVRVEDSIVGEVNAAPEGQTAWWVTTPPMSRGHGSAYRDSRILVDIARILRGETRYTTDPAAELPESSLNRSTQTSDSSAVDHEATDSE